MENQVSVPSGAPTKDAGEKQSVDGSAMSSVVDNAINSLQIELHIPGYRFCGPGTHVEERLKRGEEGVNRLDCACRDHDIAYITHTDPEHRTIADEKLAQEAKKIFKSREASFKERITAWLVAKTMKLKVKMTRRANKDAELSEIDGEEEKTNKDAEISEDDGEREKEGENALDQRLFSSESDALSDIEKIGENALDQK